MDTSKMGMIYHFFDNSFQLVSKILLSAIKRLAPYVTAILPGSLFGYTIYEFFLGFTGLYWLSLIVGMSAFVVLESAGIWSGHKIAEFYGDGTSRIRVPIIAFVLYLAIGIGTLWLLDGSVDLNVKLVGTSLFLLAAIVYTLFGFQAHQERVEAKEKREKREQTVEIIQEENRKFEMEQEAKDRDLERLLKKKKELAGIGNSVQSKQVVSQDKIDALRLLLKDNPNMTKKEMAETIGVSRPTLNKYLGMINE